MAARYLLNFIDAALKNVLGRVPGAQLISLARISRFTGDSVQSMGHSKLVRHDSLLVGSLEHDFHDLPCIGNSHPN
jgi:hypothetical protein